MDNKVLRTCLIVFLILTLLTCCCISTVGILSQIEGNPISELYQRHLNPVLIPVQTAVAPPTRMPLILEPDDPKAGMPAEIGNLFDPFWESWELLHENFVDQPLNDQRLMAGAIAGMRETMQPIVPYQPAPTGEAIPLPTPTPELIVPTRVPGSNLFDPFWAAWQELHAQNANLDDLKLMRGAIQGMLAATGDKHTSYMDPDQFAQANSEMEGEYEGIGAWVDITGEYVQIVSPMRGSPAEAAGLRAKDIVIAVDGEDMTGIPGDLVLKRILGPAGQEVILTVRRGEEVLEFKITRARITVPVVDYEMKEGNIAYIALHNFSDQTMPQMNKAFDELLPQNPAGLIFDLRNNGGGYLHTAIEVVSQFIPDGTVMYEEYGDGKRDSYYAERGGRATEIPLVVLINEGSASASEITAGAIQDLGRGRLVGVTSYGKGSVQSWIPLKSEDGGVRITIARWLTPNERQINDIGLTPDYIVELSEADYEAERDPQLDKAIQLLLGN
jgi:carboxyl-terminal processing protease